MLLEPQKLVSRNPRHHSTALTRAPEQGINRRRRARANVKWPAKLWIDGRPMLGNVVDASTSGGFFVLQSSDQSELTLKKLTQAVSLVIHTDQCPHGIRLSARVRWAGYNECHRSRGLGLEFLSKGLSYAEF